VTKGLLDTIDLFSSLLSIEMSRNRLQHANLGILHSQLFFDLLDNAIPTVKVLKAGSDI
jgi:hypothetical protein